MARVAQSGWVWPTPIARNFAAADLAAAFDSAANPEQQLENTLMDVLSDVPQDRIENSLAPNSIKPAHQQ